MNEKGFTLIELIVIIVILGILAVTAIPKYVDMKTDAEIAAANGVYGAAQGAASMNFAGNLLDKNLTPITTIPTLYGAMDGGIPDGWIDDGAGSLCRSTDNANCDDIDLDGTADGITISSGETPTAKAVLNKTW